MSSIVLLHSSGYGAGQWRALSPLLSATFEKVETPDLSGYGDVPAEAGALEADVAIGKAHVLNTPSCVLVGHSYGGLVAMRVAAELPELVTHLVVIEPILLQLVRDTSPDDPVFQIYESYSQAIEANRPEVGFEYFVDYWNGEGTWNAMGARQKRHMMGMAEKLHAEISEACEVKVSAREWGARLRDVSMTIVESQAATSAAHIIVSELARTTGATLRSVPGGHMCPLTHPQEIATLLRSLG